MTTPTPTPASTGFRPHVVGASALILAVLLGGVFGAVIAFGADLTFDKTLAAAAALAAVPYVFLRALRETREYRDEWSETRKDVVHLTVIGLEFGAAVLLAVAAFLT